MCVRQLKMTTEGMLDDKAMLRREQKSAWTKANRKHINAMFFRPVVHKVKQGLQINKMLKKGFIRALFKISIGALMEPFFTC